MIEKIRICSLHCLQATEPHPYPSANYMFWLYFFFFSDNQQIFHASHCNCFASYVSSASSCFIDSYCCAREFRNIESALNNRQSFEYIRRAVRFRKPNDIYICCLEKVCRFFNITNKHITRALLYFFLLALSHSLGYHR